MQTNIIAKFTGDEAEAHRLHAYEGVRSLYGIVRTLTLAGHFVATGDVRQRYPFTTELEIFYEPPRRGSWEAVFAILSDPATLAFGGAIAAGITANLFTDTVKTIFSRVMGSDEQPETAELRAYEERQPGHLDALVDAIEPSATEAHTVIGHGARNIVIIRGHNNIVNMNERTKEYLKTSIKNEDVFYTGR